MNTATKTSAPGVSACLSTSRGDFSYPACRNRLLVAISVAETGGFYATRESLIAVLKELENMQEKDLYLNLLT